MVIKKKVAPKKAAKKTDKKQAPPSNKLVLKTIFAKGSMWSLSCQVESVSMRIEQVKEMLELVAESMFDQKSNVVWLAADLLGNEINNLNKISEEIMGIHREQLKK